jgi:hypothetical protein
MNRTLEQFAREEILNGLSECTEAEQLMFRRMYSPPVRGCDGQFDYYNKTIEEIVSGLPAEKLDWALTQVENTLEKRQRKSSDLC